MGVAKTMDIRHRRGAMRCAQGYGSVRSQARQDGRLDTAPKNGSGTEDRFQKRKGERKRRGLRKGCGLEVIKSRHPFFPFAEVERRMDGSISSSGIHQKDPHVGGVTKSWAENEARARQDHPDSQS